MKTVRLGEVQGRSVRIGLTITFAALVAFSPAPDLLADDGALPIPVDLTAKVPGKLFICGGGRLPDSAMPEFIRSAGGTDSRIVVITTASETADTPAIEPRIEFWKKAQANNQVASMTFLHTLSREEADAAKFCGPLDDATGVWFIGGVQDRLTETYRGTKVEQRIREVLRRGGVVGGTSAGAAVMSPVMIRGSLSRTEADVGEGFGFLPGTVIDQHFVRRNRRDRLISVLMKHPKLVGIGVDENAVVVVQGRRLTVLPETQTDVSIHFAPIDGKPRREIPLKPGEEYDLVALRRTALARVQPRWRFDDDLPAPSVPEGTLILAGGGELPADIAQRFIDAAGGPDSPLVVISTAAGDEPPPESEATSWLTAAGAKQVQRVHPRTTTEAEDPRVLELLQKASGVWFTGGRQWRIIDALTDTAAERLLTEVLKRGGVIGGSAAGASVLAGYMVRGNPLDNGPIMAEGYEEGLGYLPGAAVDPYFTQRTRFADMAKLKQTYPQLVGLGIDVETAVIARGQEFEVVGKNRVYVYGRRNAAAEGERPFERLYVGDRYDLRDHKRISPDRTDADAVELADQSASEPLPATAGDGSDPRPQPSLVCE
jgi:cyanophycinase